VEKRLKKHSLSGANQRSPILRRKVSTIPLVEKNSFSFFFNFGKEGLEELDYHSERTRNM